MARVGLMKLEDDLIAGEFASTFDCSGFKNKNLMDKKMSLYGHALIRLYAHQVLHIPISSIVWQVSRFGKPFLPRYPEFQFNLSHSHGMIAVIVSKERVGIDIEKICLPHPKIVEKMFTKSEHAYVRELNDLDAHRFYEVWTKKEAYAKMIGKGFYEPFKDIDVFRHASSFTVRITGEYITTVCMDVKEKIDYEMTTEDQFIRKWREITCL